MLFLLAAGCAETVPSPEPQHTPAEKSSGISSNSSSSTSDAKHAVGPLGTAYYETSPAQGRPPDGTLPPGAIVQLLESAGSYSLVKWESKRAWVATDSLNDVAPEPRTIHKIPMH